MLWFNNKINSITTNVNPKDIAFMLASSLEINKRKGSMEKALISLECISSHKEFHNLMLEFYLIGQENKLRCIALHGINKKLEEYYYGRTVNENSAVYKSFKKQKIIFYNNSNESGRRMEMIRKSNVKSSLIVPIGSFGVIVIDRFDNLKFNDYQISLIRIFSNEIIKSSLELAIDNEKNFNSAIRDSLTGLYNHGYFKFQLEKEIENAKRSKKNLSLIMIDIDYFKHYNDFNGHPKGDKLLKEIAEILRKITRKGDTAARYGGEEFAVILHNTNLKNAFNKAEALRRSISSHKFYNEEMQPGRNLTISLGVANFPKNSENFLELIEYADKALYKSKNSGKNRVTVYTKKL